MTVENFALRKAIKQRDDFLKQNPQLQAFQDDLNKQFEIRGNDPFINMQIIKHYLLWNLGKLERIKESLTK